MPVITRQLPYVSIVIPTRNRASMLRVCLESLLEQQYPADSYEIIVVADGTTDDTAEVVAAVAATVDGPPLSFFDNERRGANAARNTGVFAARGDPVCFLDDDADVPPEWLATMAAGFLRYPDADAFAGRIRLRIESRRRRDCTRHAVATVLELGEGHKPLPVAVAANMAIRRRALARVGVFDEWSLVGGDDTEWFNRAQPFGIRTMYLGDAWVWHRRTDADVRLFRLVRSFFRRGVSSHRMFIRIGRRDAGKQARRQVPRLLREAVRERCVGALAGAALQTGFWWGLFRNRHLQPPPERPYVASSSSDAGTSMPPRSR